MPVLNIFIVNHAGSLIYNADTWNRTTATEVEQTFSYPLDVELSMVKQRVTVTWGERDGIRIGHAVLAVNGENVMMGGRVLVPQNLVSNLSEAQETSEEISQETGASSESMTTTTSTSNEMVEVDVEEYLKKEANYPVRIKFGRPPMSTDEKIVVASMFHGMYAIAVQLSPAAASSGIKVIDAEQFTLHCFRTPTGIYFLACADPMTQNLDALLRKVYEFYADFALKNPFYSLGQPIRCDLFETNVHNLIERFNKSGVLTV